MANVKISDLTGAASASGTQEFEVNDSGTSKKVTGSQLATFIEGEVSSSPTLTGQVSLDNGTNTAPSLTNTGDTNTGLYFPSDDTVGLAAGGGLKLSANASGVDITGTLTSDGLTVDLGSATDVIVNGTDGGGIQFKYGGADQVRIDSSSNDGGVYQTPTGKNHTFKTDGASRLKIATGGDISFYEDTGTTPKFFWDASAESLGIGTTSPASMLDIKGSTGNSTITLNSASAIDAYPSIGKLRFYSNDTSTNSSGEVGSIETIGIGTWNGAANNAAMTFNLIQGLAGTTSPVEAMRIDSSGNLLVGRTSTSDTVVGGMIRPDGFIQSSRDSNIAADFNRIGTTEQGDIVRFSMGSSPVGVIGSQSATGDLYIESSQSNHSGLRFSANAILPRYNTALSDGDVDLGQTSSNYRFRDLYLSGGVYLGGTGSANKLDDYETGEFTATISCGSGTIDLDVGQRKCAYTKIGKLVHIQGSLGIGTISSPSGEFRIVGAPFVMDTSLSDQAEISAASVALYEMASNITGLLNAEISMDAGVATILLRDNGGQTTSVQNIANKFDSDSIIRLSVQYMTT